MKEELRQRLRTLFPELKPLSLAERQEVGIPFRLLDSEELLLRLSDIFRWLGDKLRLTSAADG